MIRHRSNAIRAPGGLTMRGPVIHFLYSFR